MKGFYTKEFGLTHERMYRYIYVIIYPVTFNSYLYLDIIHTYIWLSYLYLYIFGYLIHIYIWLSDSAANNSFWIFWSNPQVHLPLQRH